MEKYKKCEKKAWKESYIRMIRYKKTVELIGESCQGKFLQKLKENVKLFDIICIRRYQGRNLTIESKEG